MLSDNTTSAGSFSPVMKLALITAPVVALYSPTVPLAEFATRRLLPDNASPVGLLNGGATGMTLGTAPAVGYPTTVPAPVFATRRVLPDNKSQVGPSSPVI